MNYTTYGNTGLNVSKLGYGVMRLPMDGDNVDREAGVAMLRRAYDLGVNAFDSHHFYLKGQSESTLGEALGDLDRSTYVIQTKHQMWAPLDKGETYRGHLEKSLKDLRTDYVDTYLMHSLSWEWFEARREAFFDDILKAKEEGLVRHIGLSSHDNVENVNRLIDTGLFECLLIQYNYANLMYEPCIAHAKEKGMGVSVMGPVGGGRLVSPNDVTREVSAENHPVALALKFVWSNPNVDIAFSGMGSVEQVEQNVAFAEAAGKLTDSESARLREEAEKRKKLADLFCTGCNYCMPCPKDVQVPQHFQALIWKRVYGIDQRTQHIYDTLKARDKGAVRCVACGQCLEKCPQHIDIPKQLKEVIAEFDPESTED